MWEVVTHETPVRGGMRTINVPSEAPPEVSAPVAASPAQLLCPALKSDVGKHKALGTSQRFTYAEDQNKTIH